jgi:hypothetical protein
MARPPNRSVRPPPRPAEDGSRDARGLKLLQVLQSGHRCSCREVNSVRADCRSSHCPGPDVGHRGRRDRCLDRLGASRSGQHLARRRHRPRLLRCPAARRGRSEGAARPARSSGPSRNAGSARRAVTVGTTRAGRDQTRPHPVDDREPRRRGCSHHGRAHPRGFGGSSERHRWTVRCIPTYPPPFQADAGRAQKRLNVPTSRDCKKARWEFADAGVGRANVWSVSSISRRPRLGRRGRRGPREGAETLPPRRHGR